LAATAARHGRLLAARLGRAIAPLAITRLGRVAGPLARTATGWLLGILREWFLGHVVAPFRQSFYPASIGLGYRFVGRRCIPLRLLLRASVAWAALSTRLVCGRASVAWAANGA